MPHPESLLPPALRDRFDVKAILGQGGDQRVLQVLDRKDAAARVLRVRRTHDLASRRAALAEFGLLQGLRHPGLASVLDYGATADEVFVLRDYVAGRPLGRTAVDPGGLRRLAIDLLEALGFLHAHSRLHLDLKPANIIVTEDSEPRAVLTDFGLAMEDGAARMRRARGTPPFVAPEVLLGARPDGRADLFSLGVTLLSCLPGSPSLDPREIYRRFPREDFLTAVGADPRALHEDLGPLVVSLLAHDREDRPRSALEALRLLGESPKGLPDDPRALLPAPAVRSQEAERWLRAAVAADPSVPFVLEAGDQWEEREAAARAAFLACEAGRAFQEVEAEELEEALRAAAESGEESLEARASEIVDASIGAGFVWIRPGGGVGAVKTALLLARRRRSGGSGAVVAVAGDTLPEEVDRVLETVGGERFRLPSVDSVRLVDHLASLEGHDPRSLAAAPEQRLRRVAERILEGGTRTGPEVARFLREYLSRSEAEGTKGVRFDPDARFVAAPLAERAASLSDAAREVLARFFLGFDPPSAGLDESSREDVEAYREVAARFPEAEAGGSLRAAAAAAWESLPDAERIRVAERAHRLAREAPQSLARSGRLLAAAAGGDWQELDQVLSETGGRDEPPDAWLQRVGEALRLCSDRLPAALEGRLEAERGEALVRLGRLEEARDAFARAAGRVPPAKAAAYSARSASLSLALGDATAAAAAFESARPLASRAGPDAVRLRVEIEKGLAFARAAQGRTDEALRSLEALRRRSRQPEVAAWADFLVGTLCWRDGRTARARKGLERAVAAARERGDEELLAAALSNLGALERGQGDLRQARACLEEALALRRKRRHRYEEAVLSNSLGLVLRDLGLFEEAAARLEEALEERRWLGDRVGQATTEANLADLDAERGDLAGALARLDRAERALAGTDAEVERQGVALRRAEVLLRAGDIEGAERSLSRVPRSGVWAGHRALLAAEMALRAGDPREALASARSARALADRSRLAPLAAAAGLVEAEAYLETGQTRRAGDVLKRRCASALGRTAARSRLLAGRIAEKNAAHEEALGAYLAARDEARSLGSVWIRLEALARAAGLLARHDVERAGAIAREADVLLARVRLPGRRAARRADLERLLGTDLAEALLMTDSSSPADRTPPARGRVTTEGVPVEVFRTFVAINRSLQRERQLDRLVERLVEHAVLLTGGRRGWIVLLRDERVVLEATYGESDEEANEVSRTIVKEAIESGRPVLTADAQSDPRLQGQRSIEEFELRSVVCVPFETDSGTKGAIYVDNPVREGAFTAHNLDLLEALASQAALAIGHLERRRQIEQLNEALSRRVERSERELSAARRRLEQMDAPSENSFVAESEEMREVVRRLERVAPTELPVLLLGESGTGKELLARTLHRRSLRCEGPFVAVNCSAVPDTLLESEFFGYRKGAFTGADRDHEGLFVRASGGTLFLDEIGDMPLALQAKLLRVLQEGTVRPLGSVEVVPIDVRLVCATNRDLAQAVSEGKFREDLYYRIRGAEVRIPPLRERRADIPALARRFVDELNEQTGGAKRLSKGLLNRLLSHSWPGNVRELRNEIARIYHLTDGEELRAEDADLRVLPGGGEEEDRAVVRVKPMQEIEREAIRLALEETGGRREEAARRLGISRAAFYVKLKKYGLADEIPARRRRKPPS